MSSGLKRHKRVSPMPVTSSFSKVADEPWDKKENNYTLTPDQLQEVISRLGAPTMPLSSRKPHSGMHEQRYKPTKGEKRK